MQRSLRHALREASRIASRRADSPQRTGTDELQKWARAHLGGRRLVLVSNREPWSHHRAADGSITAVRNAGGLTVSLDALAGAVGAAWVAHGSGSAARETADAEGRLPCPPDQPRYTLRRIWLDETDHTLFYAGAANSMLWPLCHVVFVRPRFDADAWERYREVNRRYAEAAIEEVGPGDGMVWLQDYHLALAARTLRERRPDLGLALFWHIPWPSPEVFRVLPWRSELLEGMLANDVLGFHIRGHALNFLQCVADTLEARVDFERMAIDRQGHRTWVRAVPIGVPAVEIGDLADAPSTRAAEQAWRERLGIGTAKVILGVDRLDYTKGVPQRLKAFGRLLERHPHWVGRAVFVQVGVPSRIGLPEYQAVQRQVRWEAARLQRRFPRREGQSVVLLEDSLDFRDIVPLYRLADVCAVTPLHDGMNLVAKEYVAACTDGEGALVLSPFAGASRELERAHLASPFDIDALAEAYRAALEDPAADRRTRMADLRETVLRRTVHDWAIEFLDLWQRLALRTSRSDPNPGGAG